MASPRSQGSTHLFTLLLLVSANWGPLAAQQAAAQRPQEAVPGTRAVTPAELQAARAPAVAVQPIKPVATFDGDHVAAGISLRNRGGGVINLRGAAEGGVPSKAFLYWDLLDNQAPQSMTVSVNGVAVTGTLIGKGADPCWGAANNFAYRAEVPLFLLYIGINGDYSIAGVPSSKGTGADPWRFFGSPPLAEGATLLVIYRAPNSPFSRTFVYEAPISGQMFTSAFNTVLGGFPASGSQAKFTLIGADGQIGGGLTASLPITSETSFFQGTQIAGPGSPFDNDSDWDGDDVQPLNQLWDTRTHVVPIKTGSTTAPVKYVSQGDCLVTVAFALSL